MLKEKQILDVTAELCPIPLIKSRAAINALSEGDLLQIISSDRGSLADFRGWNHADKRIELISQFESEENGQPRFIHLIRKGGK